MSTIPHRIAAAAILAALTAAAPAFAATAPAAPAAVAAASNTVVSSLERFRSYSGERTPSALAALFTAPASAPLFIQHPDPALSDGSTTVKVGIKSGITGSNAPNFAVNGGKLISHQRLQTGEWHLELLPDKGTLTCTLVMVSGDAVTEFTLNTAPPLAAEIDLSVQGFINYIGSPAAGSAPRLDLNADGRRDYQDDYIFTANFLARKMADPHDPASRNQRAREMTPQRMQQKPAN